jgi:hypothetical protein
MVREKKRQTRSPMVEDEVSTTSLTFSTALKAGQDRRAWKVLSEASCINEHCGIK